MFTRLSCVLPLHPLATHCTHRKTFWSKIRQLLCLRQRHLRRAPIETHPSRHADFLSDLRAQIPEAVPLPAPDHSSKFVLWIGFLKIENRWCITSTGFVDTGYDSTNSNYSTSLSFGLCRRDGFDFFLRGERKQEHTDNNVRQDKHTAPIGEEHSPRAAFFCFDLRRFPAQHTAVPLINQNPILTIKCNRFR